MLEYLEITWFLLQSEFPEYSNLKLAFYKQLVMINEHLSYALKTRTEHTIIHNINIAKMQLFYKTVNYL